MEQGLNKSQSGSMGDDENKAHAMYDISQSFPHSPTAIHHHSIIAVPEKP